MCRSGVDSEWVSGLSKSDNRVRRECEGVCYSIGVTRVEAGEDETQGGQYPTLDAVRNMSVGFGCVMWIFIASI